MWSDISLWFWFASSWWTVMLNIIHVLIGHLYIFFGEMSIQVLCPFFIQIGFFFLLPLRSSLWILNINLFYFYLLIERETDTETEKHPLVVPFMYAFLGWFLYVPWPGIKPATLAYGVITLTNWATWPGLDINILSIIWFANIFSHLWVTFLF